MKMSGNDINGSSNKSSTLLRCNYIKACSKLLSLQHAPLSRGNPGSVIGFELIAHLRYAA